MPESCHWVSSLDSMTAQFVLTRLKSLPVRIYAHLERWKKVIECMCKPSIVRDMGELLIFPDRAKIKVEKVLISSPFRLSSFKGEFSY